MDSDNVAVHSYHLLFDNFQFSLIHGPNIPGSYAIVLLIHRTLLLSPVTSTTECCFCFGPSLNSFWHYFSTDPHSILGTYRPEVFIFQCPIFLSFDTVYGFLKARILKWFVIPFLSGPHFVRTLYHDMSIFGGPTFIGMLELGNIIISEPVTCMRNGIMSRIMNHHWSPE